ncbi:pyrroline-5-carboxylate reductase [Nitrincola tapanii]|uniref:Pyrroline-5-carboxylate reductase n=1 Tax=Nitrincola tapanii TaxID=1708751 RepID=A0A5A9W2A8_9GAMM|nr:pyrroline-5-carboxylate reductase [Nitrincola tapanii]KAA0874339.1 pyrroline-5-carboxylate reductase [Nitrincola tapanii]
MQTSFQIAFIGAGNMARAIIGGLLAQGLPAQQIIACEPDLERLRDLEAQGIQIRSDNASAVRQADLVILAVKPQIMRDVCTPLRAAAAEKHPVFLSVAAGIRIQALADWLGADLALVRSMPNTPALVGKGACGLFANAQVTEQQKQEISQVMQATGLTLWVDKEDELDAVTAVSGSGPAYFFLMMEAMIAAGERLGLSPDTAKALTLQTAAGAAEMALQSEWDPAELRRRVTSPKGTTEQAILCFQQGGFSPLVDQALQACHQRAVELADELGKS